MNDRLFEPDEPAAVEPGARVSFLAGMLAEWTFGQAKPKAGQLDALKDIASEALARARAVK